MVLTLVTITYGSSAYAIIPSTAQSSVILRSLKGREPEPEHHEPLIFPPKTDETGTSASTEKVFVLNGIVLDGAGTYTVDNLKDTFNDFIGQKISFADLNKISRRITGKYRSDGYILSRVIISSQKIINGIVHFRAVEGRVKKIIFVGEVPDRNNLIAKMADKIRIEVPATAKTIERYLLLINDLPGIKARSIMRPSETPGAADLIIYIQEDKLTGSAGADNRGSESIGPYRGTLIGAINSPFGYHSSTVVRGIMASQPSELRYADIVHEDQVGSEGIHLNGHFAITESNPGGNITDLDIQGDSKLVEFGGFYPVMRSRKMNFNITGGLSALNSESDVLGVRVAEDRVRYLHAGGNYDFTDKFGGVSQLNFEVAQGIKILDATSDGTNRSRVNGKQDFLRANITVTHVHDLRGKFSLMGSITGQASPDSLLASEEFSIGGGSFGRAYDSGEIIGDQGIAGVAELRYGESVHNSLFEAYQIYGFYDVGEVYNKNPVVGENASASLASAGFGARFNIKHNLSGYIELDSPLTRKVNADDSRDSRVFFNLVKRF